MMGIQLDQIERRPCVLWVSRIRIQVRHRSEDVFVRYPPLGATGTFCLECCSH